MFAKMLLFSELPIYLTWSASAKKIT